MSKDNETAKTRIVNREDVSSAADPELEKTRVYDAVTRETGVITEHKWIDDTDEPVIRPVGRNTLTGRETQIYPPLDRRTRVGRDSNTRIVERQPSDTHLPEAGAAPQKSPLAGAGAKLRMMYRDMRNVRVGDSRRFARFMKIIGAFALMLLLELGYFGFAHMTEAMPDRIKEVRDELELTQKENEILSEEIQQLGDHDSIEKNRLSWERLKDRVEKAAEETSS